MVPWLLGDEPFPPVDQALAEPPGLLAVGGNLSVPRILAAYRQGIFPWFNEGEPILWWSPDPRMVLFPEEFRLSRSLRKTIRHRGFQVRVDGAFRQVMEACAEPRRGQAGTWINPRMVDAYSSLHRLGCAHSVETWLDGELVGGLYGVGVGRAFFGESMFSRVSDASKTAFAHLVRQLARWGYPLIDCQMRTEHLASLGAREIARSDFTARLRELVNSPGINGPWRFDHDLFE